MRNRTCFHHASYSTLLKYYLFLGEKYSEKQIIFSCPRDRNRPRAVFSNPSSPTVHATEQAKEPQTNSMTCTNSGAVCAGWHSLTEEEDSITSNSSSKTNTSPLAWLWSLITSLWISATSLFT